MYDAANLLKRIQALSHPVRLWIIAKLEQDGKQYVSALAREAKISRPLMKIHLLKLEKAGLVSSELGLAENGKAANFYKAVDFQLPITPANIAKSDPVSLLSIQDPEGDKND